MCGDLTLRERCERPGEKVEVGHDAVGILAEPVCRLEHRGTRGVGGIVLRDGVAVGGEEVDLSDDVEVAPLVQLDVDDHARLETRPELRLRLAHALRDGALLAVIARQHRDDAIGLPQLVGAQHDGGVTVEGRHVSIVSRLPASAIAGPRLVR